MSRLTLLPDPTHKCSRPSSPFSQTHATSSGTHLDRTLAVLAGQGYAAGQVQHTRVLAALALTLGTIHAELTVLLQGAASQPRPRSLRSLLHSDPHPPRTTANGVSPVGDVCEGVNPWVWWPLCPPHPHEKWACGDREAACTEGQDPQILVPAVLPTPCVTLGKSLPLKPQCSHLECAHEAPRQALQISLGPTHL